jgi:hypothetical protein
VRVTDVLPRVQARLDIKELRFSRTNTVEQHPDHRRAAVAPAPRG